MRARHNLATLRVLGKGDWEVRCRCGWDAYESSPVECAESYRLHRSQVAQRRAAEAMALEDERWSE